MSEQHVNLYEAHAGQINSEEAQLLKEHEPSIEFHVVQENLSQGRQSRVSVLEYERSGQKYRVLWKRMGANKALEAEEAQLLQSRLQPYRQSLIDAGWRVPHLLYTKVAQLSGENQIFSYEQFIAGGDGEKVFGDPSEPNFRKWFLMNEVIATLAHYPEKDLHRTSLAGKILTRLPHGLDLKLANCVLEPASNELYFVDLFGPKELDKNKNWLTYSTKLDNLNQESLLAVCASREGAILRCWRLAEQHWHNAINSASELRSEFISRLTDTNLPAKEQSFIIEEISQDYPWLNKLYKESKI
ncbi:MAG: hypothetical protein ACREGA_03855 [Candidatus Saccharimonadales bacterium]